MSLQKLFSSPLGRLLLILIGLSIYFLIFAYPLNSLLAKLDYPALKHLFIKPFTSYDLTYLLLCLLPLVGRLLYQFLHNSFSRHLMAITMTWGGFCFFIFFPTIFLDLLNLIFKFDDEVLRLFSAFTLFTCTVLCFYGIINANLLKVNTIEFSSAKLSKSSTAIQLSDVHIGSRSSYFINRLIHKVNALKPDKVFITGDLVDLSCVDENDLSILKHIQAPVYFVTGNHDRYVSLKRLLPILERQNFTILRNECIALDEYDLIGIDDADHPRQVEHVIQNIHVNPERYNILLYHRPQGFDAAIKKGVDLMLSGHTHNGQIIPFNFFVKQVFKDIKGTKSTNGAHLHVSTGTSTWGPIIRIGSSNEITFINLEPKN